eukprot:m.216996 g.216996  ORF g.216996 m.216996 type:complete len:123 (-) comp28764_c0_seq1:350-718(-)
MPPSAARIVSELTENHTRHVRLLFTIMGILMVGVMLMEWSELPPVQPQAPRTLLHEDDIRDARDMNRPMTLSETIRDLEVSVERAKRKLENLEMAFEQLDPLPEVREHVEKLNRKLFRQPSS